MSRDHWNDAELLALIKAARVASQTLADALELCVDHAKAHGATGCAADYSVRHLHARTALGALSLAADGLEE